MPLRHLLDPRNAAYRPILRDGVTQSRPAVLFQGHYIWGLTYRVLAVFFERMQLPSPGRSEIGSFGPPTLFASALPS